MALEDSTTTLDVSFIYGAMIRPSTVFGVQFEFLVTVFILAMILFIVNPVFGFISMGCFWFVGFLLTRFDPDFFKVLHTVCWMSLCPNRAVYDCVYFEAY